MKFLLNHIHDIMGQLQISFTEKICYFKLNIPISAAAYNGKINFLEK